MSDDIKSIKTLTLKADEVLLVEVHKGVTLHEMQEVNKRFKSAFRHGPPGKIIVYIEGAMKLTKVVLEDPLEKALEDE